MEPNVASGHATLVSYGGLTNKHKHKTLKRHVLDMSKKQCTKTKNLIKIHYNVFMS